MSITVELGDGQSAQLRDPTTLTNGQRRPLIMASTRYLKQHAPDPALVREIQRATVRKDQARLEELAATLDLNTDEEEVLKVGDVAIVALVESWTLSLPLPSERPIVDDEGRLIGSEVLDDISAWDYDRLQRAVGTLVPQTRWSGEPPAGKGRRSASSKKP